MQEDSNSSVRDITSLHYETSKLISRSKSIKPFTSHSENTNKQYCSDAMDTQEEGTARTPKKKKTEAKG